jgi:hypothetical protein
MAAGESVPESADDRSAKDQGGEWDAPTPPAGIPIGGSDVPAPPPHGSQDVTPPSGIPGIVGADGVVEGGVVGSEDFGRAGPAVFGGEDPVEAHDDAGDWPTLEYRSRNKPQRSSGTLDWLRRRRDNQ